MSAKNDPKINLNPFFQGTLENIGTEVENLSSEAILAEITVDRLARKFALESLAMDKASTHVSIRERNYRKAEIPEGKSIDKGTKLQVAHFRVHVSGSPAALKWVMEQSGLAKDGLSAKGSYLVYEHPSYEGPIETSEARQKKIKDAAKKRLEECEALFSVVNEKIQAFNNELPEKIKPLIEKQKSHLEALKAAESKLNPFG